MRPSHLAALLIGLVGVAYVASRPVRAQQSSRGADSVEFFSAALLAKTARTVASHPSYQLVESRRIESGVPEVHDNWIDVAIVQSGRATLLVGGRVQGGQLASPGEHRGGSIIGGMQRPITPGDLFTIPAGVPHQYLIPRGDSVRYLTIKVPHSARDR
jgi:mannose-6-phosphate isomerase-like protein (cupin superfamily)